MFYNLVDLVGLGKDVEFLPGRSAAALRDYSVTTSQSTFSRMPGPHRALELAEQREINH